MSEEIKRYPYMIGHMRGMKEDVIWEYYYHLDEPIERRVPGTLKHFHVIDNPHIVPIYQFWY